MTNTFEIAVRFIIAVLVNGLWEAALLALVAWIVLRVQPNANATTRHSVLAAALFASLILPIVTASITTLHLGVASDIVPAAVTHVSQPVHQVVQTPSHKGTSVSVSTVAKAEPAFASTPTAAPSWPRLNLVLPRVVAFTIVGLWLAGAAFVLLHLVLSLLHLERLKRDALPLPMEYRSQLVRWAAAVKGSRTVRLCRSDEIVIPLAVGLFDAMILVPERLLEELGHEDIDRIVLHELAHLRRSDDWLNAIERVAQALLFFNPGIWWINGRLDLEREVACDDWVLQQNEALPYATCLAKVVETTIWPYRAMSAPGAFVTRRGMSVRIERLLSTHRDVRVRTSFGAAGAAVVLLGALSIAAAFVSPSIAYTGSTPAVAPIHAPLAAIAVPAHLTIAPSVAKRTAPTVAAAVKTNVTAARANAAATDSIVARAVASAVPPKVAPMLASADSASAMGGDLKNVVAADSPGFIDEMASVGYTNLSIDQFVQLKAVGVTADYVREVEKDGEPHPTIGELVSLRALNVDPAFIHEMRGRFGDSLSLSKIEGLKATGVSTEYVDELKSMGMTGLDAGQVQGLRATGVTTDYVRDMANAGYPHLSADQALQMRSMGIDAAFISTAAAHGFRHLSIDQLTQLKASGIL